MISRFRLPVPVLSMVSNVVLDFIYNTHRHRITQWNHNVLNPAALQIYSNVISDKGAALHNCFGFVDGTVRPVCRPGEHQRVIYNSHKRVHTLKFQCVALPNGLIGNLYGPVGKFVQRQGGRFQFQYVFNNKYWKSVRGEEREAYVTNLHKKHF